MGIEAGLSACGYLFEALASRTGRSVRRPHRGPARLSRGTDGAAAPHVGQRRPHGAGEPQPRRRDAGLEPQQHGRGRPVLGDRRHRVPHAGDLRPHARARRAASARDSRRRHPAEERRAEPGVRQRAQPAGAGAGDADHQPWQRRSSRFSRAANSPASRRRRRRCARAIASAARPARASRCTSGCIRCIATCTSAWERRMSAPQAVGHVLPTLRAIAAEVRRAM